MARASKEKLNALHDLVASYYTDILASGDQLSSGELAAINSFLKTNEITAEIVESEALGGLSYQINNIMEEAKKAREA